MNSIEIEIAVNGETRRVPTGLTVAALLAHLGVAATRVGVERNKCLVRKAEHETTPVEAGDRFEIVSFVGGG
ncbi:MAG: sulfur carrier protein ThiS [Planctomycetota bacterium]